MGLVLQSIRHADKIVVLKFRLLQAIGKNHLIVIVTKRFAFSPDPQILFSALIRLDANLLN